MSLDQASSLWNSDEYWDNVPAHEPCFPPQWQDIEPLEPEITRALERGDDPFETVWKKELDQARSSDLQTQNEKDLDLLSHKIASFTKFGSLPANGTAGMKLLFHLSPSSSLNNIFLAVFAG